MAPFFSSFKPYEHWKKKAPPLRRSEMNTAVTLSGVWRCCSRSGGRGCCRCRSLREERGVGSNICGEEEVLMMAMMTGGGGGEGGKEEDEFLVPVIEDDFDWFGLSIAYLEEGGGINGDGGSGGLWRSWELRDGDERQLQGKANLAGTYDPCQRWETSYQEVEAAVPVEMNHNRSVAELEGSCSWPPPSQDEKERLSVASVHLGNQLGRRSGVTLCDL